MEIRLTLAELRALYEVIQKPNKIDDYVEPIRTARAKIAEILYLDTDEVKNG